MSESLEVRQKRDTRIVIDEGICTGCGACVALCVSRVLQRADQHIVAVDPNRCIQCGHCVAVCPVDAIKHSAHPLGECPQVDTTLLPSVEGLVTSLRERRSARVFRSVPVPRGLVQKLVDIARWTPTASNTQPVDWLAIDDPARIAALSAEAVDALARTTRLLRNPLLLPFLRLTVGRGKVNKGVASIPEFETLVQRHRQGEDPIFYRAPVVLVAHVPIDDYFGRDHSIYAVYNLMLAAQRMGLGVCQMGYFALALDRSSALRRALDLPKDRRPEATVILGFQQYRFRRAPLRRRPEITWV